MKETTPRCFPDCSESCPLAEAVRAISRLVEEKIECERQLRVFVDALKEADRRLENIALSTGASVLH